MRPKRLITPFIILFLLLLSACGESGGGSTPAGGGNGSAQQGLTSGNAYLTCPTSPNTSAAAAESGKISISIAIATSSPAEESLVNQNIKGFESANPTIHVDIQNIGTGYTDKMRANVASGHVPDAFYLQMDMASEYIPNDKLLNLSPYMQRDKVLPTDYYPSLLRPFSCKSGQVYGIAKDWNTLGVFYNKQMFQAAGIAAPTANWTWQEMRDDAKKLTKAGNAGSSVYGISLAADPSRWLAFQFSDGGSVLNSDGTKAAFNNQTGIDSLNFYTGFEKDGSSVVPGDVGASWPGEAFGKQRAAMALEGGWLIPYMSQNYQGVQYDIAPLPQTASGKRANLLYTEAWGGYAGTKHPEATWQFIKYMTGKDAQAVQLHAGFALPSIKSLASDAYFTQHPGFKVMFDAAPNGYADFYGPHNQTIVTSLTNAIDEVLKNKKDVPGALKQAEYEINTDLSS